jgi:hypothetical protein
MRGRLARAPPRRPPPEVRTRTSKGVLPASSPRRTSTGSSRAAIPHSRATSPRPASLTSAWLILHQRGRPEGRRPMKSTCRARLTQGTRTRPGTRARPMPGAMGTPMGRKKKAGRLGQPDDPPAGKGGKGGSSWPASYSKAKRNDS